MIIKIMWHQQNNFYKREKNGKNKASRNRAKHIGNDLSGIVDQQGKISPSINAAGVMSIYIGGE